MAQRIAGIAAQVATLNRTAEKLESKFEALNAIPVILVRLEHLEHDFREMKDKQR